MDMQILAQQFYDYSVFTRNYSKATVKRYRHYISYYCLYSGLTQINQVTDANVRALFLHGRVDRKWSTDSYLGCHKSLRVFFRWCITEGHLISNPIDKIELPKSESRLPVKLTKQDALKLLETISNYPYDNSFLRYRNHAIFSMFIFTGLRKNELLQLKLSDIDIENLTIFVRQGKGKKDRIVPMSHTLAISLKWYFEYRKKMNKTCPEFFASQNKNVGITEAGLKLIVSQIRIASSIKFSAHKLRHTFATLMLEGGCDIYSLSRMMGHSDIKTTTIYLYATPEHLRSQMTKHPLNNL